MPSSLTTGPRRNAFPADPRTRRILIRLAIGLTGGLIVGYPTGYLAGKLRLGDWLAGMPGEDLASLAVAAALLCLGLFAIVAASSAAIYRRLAANYEAGDPLDRGTLRYLRLSGVIMVLAGLLLLAPPLAARFDLAGNAAMAAAVGIGLLLAVQNWLNIKVVRDSDELSRASVVEASAVSFWLLQGGLFGWAALFKLGLVQAVSMWTMVIIVMAVYLAVSIVSGVRRGLFA